MSNIYQNHALLATREQFNPFTDALKEACSQRQSVLVTLRNETSIKICFMKSDDFQGFATKDWEFVWNNDGSSIKNYDFDMISFKN